MNNDHWFLFQELSSFQAIYWNGLQFNVGKKSHSMDFHSPFFDSPTWFREQNPL